MKTIELITHCYATELPQYAAALCYQLSSIAIYQSDAYKVSITVCCEPNDKRTLAVIPVFNKLLKIKTLMLRDANVLGRRSIGRNIAAKTSGADIVWFTDVDYLFPNFRLWDELSNMPWPGGVSMVFPADVSICKDHATGDKLLARAIDKVCLVDTNPIDFVPHHHSRAIGGVQIVQGDFARKHGYLDGEEKWQTPATKPFGDFRDDVAYRSFCKHHGDIVPVNIPGIRRLRHSETTYQ